VYCSTSASLPPVIWARSSSCFPSFYWSPPYPSSPLSLLSVSYFLKLLLSATFKAASSCSTKASILIEICPITKKSCAKWMSVISCLSGILSIVWSSSCVSICKFSISSGVLDLKSLLTIWCRNCFAYSWLFLDFKLNMQFKTASHAQNHSRSFVPKVPTILPISANMCFLSDSLSDVSKDPLSFISWVTMAWKAKTASLKFVKSGESYLANLRLDSKSLSFCSSKISILDYPIIRRSWIEDRYSCLHSEIILFLSSCGVLAFKSLNFVPNWR